jgi:hypothetical protein
MNCLDGSIEFCGDFPPITYESYGVGEISFSLQHDKILNFVAVKPGYIYSQIE